MVCSSSCNWGGGKGPGAGWAWRGIHMSTLEVLQRKVLPRLKDLLLEGIRMEAKEERFTLTRRLGEVETRKL